MICYGRFCVLILLYLYSTFQLPWSAWVVPLCCVYLLLLSSHTSHQCFSLPWFPSQSCVTSYRSTSESHHGKSINQYYSGNRNVFYNARLHCRIAVLENLMFKFGPVKAMALSESEPNPLWWKRVILPSAFVCSSLSRTSGRHEQGLCPWSKFLRVHRTQKNSWILSFPRAACWVRPRKCVDRTGKLMSAYPIESGNLQSQGEAGECCPLRIQHARASSFVLGAF